MNGAHDADIAVFTEALRLTPEERDRYLSEACTGDVEFRRRVEALLQAYEQAGDFLGRPAAERPAKAAQVLPAGEKPGDRIGHYKLLRQIGEGGWGVVYMAEQVEPVRRRVALKIIKPGMDTKNVIGRFEAERQALALMDHPNIAKVFDAGATEAGRPYFLQEIAEAARLAKRLVDQLPGSQEVLDEPALTALRKEIGNLPPGSVTKAVQQLFETRQPLIGEVVETLSQVGNLNGQRHTADLILGEFEKPEFGNNEVFRVAHVTAVLSKLPAEEQDAARKILHGMLPRVASFRECLIAGIGLLERMEARQYYKGVFRFLPNVSAENLQAAYIADTFLNSRTRFIAEREIECRAGLPAGAVVIHCPKADGPTKIAKILITSGMKGTENCRPLSKIGQLLPPMFTKHESAITALQEMYASMWRLVVSVAPKYTGSWRTIAKSAGEVLYEILSKGNNVGGPAKNDPYMELELEASAERDADNQRSSVLVRSGDGAEQTISGEAFDRLLLLQETIEERARESGSTLEGVLEELITDTTGKSSTDEGPETRREIHEVNRQALEESIASALLAYRRHVVEAEWAQIEEHSKRLSEEARNDPAKAERLMALLRDKGLPLLPGEKLAKNRAPAKVVIDRLDELLAQAVK